MSVTRRLAWGFRYLWGFLVCILVRKAHCFLVNDSDKKLATKNGWVEKCYTFLLMS